MSHCEFGLQPTLHTKWGTAKLTSKGYFQISDNHTLNTKKLHRLIYEDFWGVRLLPEIHIHHKDGNGANNCILNLEAMTKSEHMSFHNSEREINIDTKLKQSKIRNTSGFFRVGWVKDTRSKTRNGYWRYRQYIGNGKSEGVYANTLEELKQKVLSKGWIWKKL